MKRLMLAAAAFSFFLCSCSESTQAPADIPLADNAPPSPKSGRALFMDNCSQCHRVQRSLTGPALEGVLGRWNNDTTRLVRFVRNSQRMIEEGDAYANKIYKEWNEVQMPANTHLSDQEVKSILAYIAEGKD